MKTTYFLQKKSILFVCFSLLITTVYAGPVGKEKAQRVAQNFLSRELKANLSKSATTYQAIMNDANKSQCLMHVFKGDNSYIVVSADDRVYPVLAYSNEGTFPAKGKVAPFDWWMDNLAKGIASESRLKSTVKQDVATAWDLYSSDEEAGLNTKNTKAVLPLLSTFWNQDGGYNYYSPVATGGPDGKCYAGCVATAMAQVMKRYDYPQQGSGSYSYNHPAHGVLSADFANTTYNWNNMGTVTSAHDLDTVNRNAIAKLIYHCGVSIEMNYLPSGSGANTSNVPYSLYTYFKYRRYIDFVERTNFTDDVWCNILIENLDMGYPMVYNGYPAGGGSGHAWVCDGYDSPTHFHFDFGWSGAGNAYLYLNDINSGNGNFTSGQGAVINIVPDLPTYPICASKTYTAQNYTFTDGSYTDDYWNNTNCQWLIKPDTLGTDTLKLSFLEFRTQANDLLYVYDGENASAAQVSGSPFSGHTLPATLTSTSGAFFLVFVTDGADVDLGWKVSYFAKEVPVVGIQENEVATQLNVYPNPAHDQLNISGNFNFSGNAKYSVSNILGSEVLSSEMNISEGVQNKTIDISQLKAGVYVLVIENQKAKAYTKFVVK